MEEVTGCQAWCKAWCCWHNEQGHPQWCAWLNPKTFKCDNYDQRPLDCVLYPRPIDNHKECYLRRFYNGLRDKQ